MTTEETLADLVVACAARAEYPFRDVLADVKAGRLEGDPEEIERFVAREVARRSRIRDAVAAGDWDEAFSLLGQVGRGYVLELFGPRLEPDALRRLLRDWWNMTEGVRPREAIGLFQRVGFVTDADEPLPIGELTVYRGARTPRHRLGLSWTLEPERARFFAQRFTAGTGVVYVAHVDAEAVLAYFTSRNEAEVIVDPITLRNIHRLAPTGAPTGAQEGKPA